MLAYPKHVLECLHINEQADEALQLQLVSKKTAKEINAAYPVDVYQPNMFVAIGLGLLTLLVVLAGFGLFGLVTGFDSFNGITLVYGIGCYACLEYITRVKKHYGSGVDNVLMIAVVVCITTAFTGLLYNSIKEDVLVFLCSTMTAFFLAFRFVDRAMAVVGCVLFLLLVYTLITLDNRTNVLLVYGVMVVCAAVIAFSSFKASALHTMRFHKHILRCMGYVGMVAVYVCSNYYVVQNKGILAGRVYYEAPVLLPMGWIFWSCTILIPLVYLAAGLQRKNLVIARMGVVLGIISIITFRYYFALLPLETVLVISGNLLIGSAFLLIRYLRIARHGFIFKTDDETDLDAINVEGLTTVEAYEAAGSLPEAAGTQFGGGNFGGGGSGGRY